MRFNKLDLNLLVALDMLLKERSITRAAERLNLSPSAVSNALSRLREYFDDELLVQIGRRMEVTPRALNLHDAVRDVLLRIDTTITAQPAFEPRESDRVFRLFTSDYTQFVWGPSLLALAEKEGFTGQFEFLPQVSDPQRELERGEVDLVIIPANFMSDENPCEVLYEEHFVCVLSPDSALASQELDQARYLAARHIVMLPPGRHAEPFEGWFMRQVGVTRDVAVRTYSFTVLPALVAGTELIATVHARLAERLTSLSHPLVIRPCPFQIHPMRQTMQWHRYRDQDPGVQWLRRLASKATVHMDAGRRPAV
ncbi:LysR family transcriptional regulator [Roseateles sp. SL47]|uniref:LysR family transcriptional regulator n=1 Tax=Roseateles sp. SL47 TaxID=2995138 RepID=UPI002272257D|nr:LysR family transcriptional regulator [Roseateles sp. SL47]WAC70825.1 LysR family transcriptional regulator [Roseateles sp. SL47]